MNLVAYFETKKGEEKTDFIADLLPAGRIQRRLRRKIETMTTHFP